MRCNNTLVYGWKSKKSIKKPPIVLASISKEVNIPDIEFWHGWIISHQEVCNGEIESQIELDTIPYYGGVDYCVEVRFRCLKCKSEHAGDYGLPSDIDGVNKLLTEVISKL